MALPEIIFECQRLSDREKQLKGMLNYIIPPIVIILSLAALIFFLFRKSAKISEELILQEKRKDRADAVPNEQKLFRFTQFILRLTERGMQYFKLFSLKFYNKADNWFHSIKERREKRSGIESDGETTAEKIEARKVFQGNIDLKRPAEAPINKVIVNNVKIIAEEEAEVEPMISKEVVQPDSRMATKNEFERALIERIALNPRDIEAYERLGDYYIETGNFNDSLSCFEEVLKLSPVNRRAKIKMKRLQKIVYIGLSK